MRIAWLALVLIGCGGHGESITTCEGGGTGAKCCVNSSGCDNFESCANPDQFPGCGGICPATCSADSECGTGNVCQQQRCIECAGLNACQPSCATAGCREGQICNPASGHCGDTPCSTDDACSIDFHCDGFRCVRRSCVESNDCDQFCVDGECFQAAGVCIQPTG